MFFIQNNFNAADIETSIAGIIAAAIVGLIIIAILLKILSKHYIAIMVFMFLSAIAIIVSSFAMPHLKSDQPLNWYWVIAQVLSIFLFCVISCAGIAFDREEYEHTTEYYDNWDDTIHRTTKLESRSMFWSVLGSGLFVAVVLVTLNYVIFVRHAIALGVIGCLAAIFPLVVIIKHFIKKHRRNRDYY